MDYSLIAAFTIGLFSTLHCLGMCGGIIGALTFSLPPPVREDPRRLRWYVLAYNLGRIGAYTLAGAIIGALGTALFQLISPEYGYVLIQSAAGLVLLGIGLYLAGWFPGFAQVEHLGAPLWKRLEPLGRRLLPVRSPLHALLFGSIWGWLPCGLVYATLLWAATAGDAALGAGLMLAFGLGTLPGVAAAGLLTGWMVRLGRLPYARQGVGLVMVVMAVISLGLALSGLVEVRTGATSASHQHHLHVQ